jgi:spore coat protein U-like protein
MLAAPVSAVGFGSNGLLTIPTADTLPASYLDLSYQEVIGIDGGDGASFNYGLQEGVQLGGRVKWLPGEERLKLYPGLKVNLINEAGLYQPTVSLGLEDRDLYLVASKMMTDYNVRLHLGIGDQSTFSDTIFLGASKVLNPVIVSSGDNSLSIPTVEAQVENNSRFNLGTKLRFGSGVELGLGVIDLDNFRASIGFRNQF